MGCYYSKDECESEIGENVVSKNQKQKINSFNYHSILSEDVEGQVFIHKN